MISKQNYLELRKNRQVSSYILVYMCRMHVLKFVMYLKHVRRYKCVVQSSAFLVRVTIPFYTESYGIFSDMEHREEQSFGSANKGLRQHLSLNHTICSISCSATAWNISSWEETELSHRLVVLMASIFCTKYCVIKLR